MTRFHKRNHPLRDALDQELRQRTFPALTAPCRLCQFVLTVSPSSRSEEFQVMQALASQQGSPLKETDNDINLPLFGGTLRWEKHGEFSSYTLIKPGIGKTWFDDPLDFLPASNWFDPIPGQVFRVIQLSIVSTDDMASDGDCAALFNPDHCISSFLADKKARIWTDFQKHAEGAGRMLMQDNGLSPAGLGRLVQQLFDLGNYRKLSLLGWPQVRKAMSQLNELEQQLSYLTQRVEQERGNDESLLDEITSMAAQTEHLIAENSSRLQANSAYYQLALDRIKSLNETPIDGMMSLQDFTERRLTPAVRTSESVVFRQNALSNRLGRSTELLRTRISLKLEEHNQRLLASMDKRAQLQLKLQTMVESLSVVAISYYALQLSKHGFEALLFWWPELNVGLWQSLSVPVVITSVILLLLWFRRRLHINKPAESSDKPL
ncbi:DUF3422 domain-containing protein [Alkalimonas collagenimarina]|uniref:DUF3422 domain-containing protein n=1 Tax=Alkalimonas collagenimarina TaxID=400390 RepID=A0ABT9H3K7_9GAMM|nr:DUF3422 domain-containing protein [Alkalimonas collagenimarina]MDP4537881.1 DUF3422 domain-containing protein [Alkalimonas collagenimarina]